MKQKKVNTVDTSIIGEEIKAVANSFASLATENIKTSFTDFMTRIMTEYYSEYTPIYYRRENQLFDPSTNQHNSYELVEDSVNGFSNITLNWTPERMLYKRGGKYRDAHPTDAGLVIESFLNSTHGGKIPMGFDPYKMILQFRRNKKKELCAKHNVDRMLSEAKSRCALKFIK